MSKIERKKNNKNNLSVVEQKPSFVESVLSIRRVAKVIKGGRRLTFSAFVVVGDGNGKIGVAIGKGREVAPAVSKAFKRAKKDLLDVPLNNATIEFDVTGKFGSSKVLMKPAAPGTGVIAGGAVRLIMNALGVKNVLSKTFGSTNSINVAYAVMKAFKRLNTLGIIKKVREVGI